jgi:hypothetical protein
LRSRVACESNEKKMRPCVEPQGGSMFSVVQTFVYRVKTRSFNPFDHGSH